MNTKQSFLLLIMILLLNACSPFVVVRSAGEQPAPVDATQPARASTGYQPITVDDVQVQVGVGSPIPVHAVVSVDLPGYGAQLGEVRMHRAEKTFFIRLVAYLPAGAECSPDTLPYLLQVPLNIVNLPEGSYEVNVNGTTTSFEIPAK